MGITYQLLPQHSAVLVRASGRLDLAALRGHLSQLADDPRLPQPHVTLFDLRDVSEVDLSPEDIHAITDFTVERGPKLIAAKLALVTQGEAETDLAERYRRLAEGFRENTLVFFNRDVACVWLGIPRDV